MKEADLEKLEQDKMVLEKQITEEEKRHRMELRKWERKIKESEQRLDTFNKELKEKEQENRISKLKIKEMRRLIKHNQLKPIHPMQPAAVNGMLALPPIEADSYPVAE
jgi:hypothetical protein